MNKEVKTLGYLLKHYTDSQCYDQYVPLSWLKEQTINEIDKHKKHDVLKCESLVFYNWFLSLLEES